jgi:hypothetical protein
MLHIENSYASGQKKRPRGPRSTPAVELSKNLVPLLQPPLIELKTHAVVYYLHYHLHPLIDAPSITQGISDDFLSIWQSRAECPILDLAVSSMALAVYSHTQQHPPAQIEASMRYQQLLPIIRKTILSVDERNIDDCLLAIFFMSRYEQVVYRPSRPNPKIPFATMVQGFSHHDGALAIVKVWKTQLSHCLPVTDIIKHTRRAMVRSALLRNRGLPEWILDGSRFGEQGLELEYDSIMVRIVNVRQRLAALLKKTDPFRVSQELSATAEEIDQDARDIEKSLQDWTSHFPSTWCYQRHTLPDPHPWPKRDFYSTSVLSFPSPAYAALWNRYFAMTMLINSLRLRALKIIHPCSDDFIDEQSLECLSRIKSMADDLASSVPFCLQRFKVIDNHNSSSHQDSIIPTTSEDIKPYIAGIIIWPLSVASSISGVDIKQRTWFRSEVARFGRMEGDKVLECAELDPWLEI